MRSGEKPRDPSKFKTKTRKGGHPGKAYTKQKTLICIAKRDLFGHLRDANPIPSYQWRPKFGHGRKMNPSHANGFRGSDVLQARLNRAIKHTKNHTKNQQKNLICIFKRDLFGHLRDAYPIPSYQIKA